MKAKNTADLVRSAKGVAAYLSANRLHELSARLEALGCSADQSETQACLDELRAELKRCLEYTPDVLATSEH